MSNEQKLREAFEARMTDNGKWPRAVEQGRNGCYLLAQTENAWAEWQACAEALATTEPDHFEHVLDMVEPEPTGMPELPPAGIPEDPLQLDVGDLFTIKQIRDYGKQCWKAGYKQGAWGDKPAVNQQLTTEPVTNDTKDAKRYRWLADGNNYAEAARLISDGSLSEDALGKAIDAAMAKGVK